MVRDSDGTCCLVRRSEESVMTTEQANYVISTETNLPFGEAVEKARSLLQDAGYGVLSEIDVQAKLNEKLDTEREPYLILGACNPPLAKEALDAGLCFLASDTSTFAKLSIDCLLLSPLTP